MEVSGNSVLRRIFGPKRERENISGCRKQQNEELRILYFTPNISTVNRSWEVK
jgi:hypothetical protein